MEIFKDKQCKLLFDNLRFITVRNSSCGKVMFSQACVKNSVRGGVHCKKGVHGRGVHGRRLAWQGGLHGRECVAGGVYGGGEACVTGETATAADGTHPPRKHPCFTIETVNGLLHNVRVF